MSFVERVNQGESLASGLNWLTEPPAVCWSVIMGAYKPSGKGKSAPIQMPSERVQEAVLCTACFGSLLCLLIEHCLAMESNIIYWIKRGHSIIPNGLYHTRSSHVALDPRGSKPLHKDSRPIFMNKWSKFWQGVIIKLSCGNLTTDKPTLVHIMV